eukprot:m.33334 g.33334  ORF g.33334 m.33334 type:complete len:1005 (+) comp11007_c0_seq5:360-3374(+)
MNRNESDKSSHPGKRRQLNEPVSTSVTSSILTATPSMARSIQMIQTHQGPQQQHQQKQAGGQLSRQLLQQLKARRQQILQCLDAAQLDKLRQTTMIWLQHTKRYGELRAKGSLAPKEAEELENLAQQIHSCANIRQSLVQQAQWQYETWRSFLAFRPLTAMERQQAQAISLQLRSIVDLVDRLSAEGSLTKSDRQLLQMYRFTEMERLAANQDFPVNENSLDCSKEILRSILQSARTGEKQPFNRSKLVMVGEGAVGKTSTVRSLLGQQFVPDHISTQGAAVTDAKPIAASADTLAWREIGREFLLNHYARTQRQIGRRSAEEKRESTGAATDGLNPGDSELLLDDNGTQKQRSESSAAEGSDDSRAQGKSDVPEDSSLHASGVMRSAKAAGQSSSAKSSTTKDSDESVFRVLKDKIKLDDKDEPNAPLFTIWDLGGQPEFHCFLPMLITRNAVYVVCFDIQTFRREEKEHVASLDALCHWLDNITLLAPSSKIAIVGTHRDDLEQAAIKSIHESLKKQFKAHPSRTQWLWYGDQCFFDLDNRKSGKHPSEPAIAALRTAIDKAVREGDYVNQEVPTAWLVWYDSVRSEGSTRHVQLNEVKATVKDADLMLQVFHEFGLLLHFPEQQLRDFVVLDPEWIVAAFSAVIRDFTKHELPGDKDAERYEEPAWVELTKNGTLNDCLLKYLWPDKPNGKQFAFTKEERNFCLSLLSKYHLISEIKEKLNSHLVPALLQKSVQFMEVSYNFTAFIFFHRESATNLLPMCNHVSVHIEPAKRDCLVPLGLFPCLVCALHVKHENASQTSNLGKDGAEFWLGTKYVRAEQQRLRRAIEVRVEDASVLQEVFVAMQEVVDTSMPLLKDRWALLVQYRDNILVPWHMIYTASQCGQQLPFADGKREVDLVSWALPKASVENQQAARAGKCKARAPDSELGNIRTILQYSVSLGAVMTAAGLPPNVHGDEAMNLLTEHGYFDGRCQTLCQLLDGLEYVPSEIKDRVRAYNSWTGE